MRSERKQDLLSTTGQIAVLVATRCFAVASFCQFLIPYLLSKDWSVVVAAALDDYAEPLSKTGAVVEPIPFPRGSVSPLRDMKSFLRLVQIFRKYKPYLIHHFHPRPIILGNLAARSVGMAKVVNTVSGVGYAFTRNGATRYVAEVGYRLALSRSQAEIFVNHEDKNLFLQKKWSNEEKARLIVSHGVDTSRFSPSKERHTNLRVLMVSRLLWQKGVREFVEAAEIIKERHPAARFQLAGEWDLEHPNAVDKAWVEDSVAKGTIEFLGYIDNMEEYLQQIDIFVLPSFYREGLPRVLLEAAACGVPVVTTDMPGCRKAVVDGETGFIVPPQDAVALSEALSELLSDPSMRRQMGRQGRELVEEKFDKRVITEKYLDVYREMGLDL